MHHSQEFLGFRFVIFRLCVMISIASLLANFLPSAAKFEKHRKLHALYLFLVDYIAFFALNWRAEMPSLEAEFLGFRRRVSGTYTHWREQRAARVAQRPVDHNV